MRFDRILMALAGLLACAGVQAADLEPALGVRLAFGGDGITPLHLGIRLDYADHGVAAREDDERLPAAMELAYTGAGRLGLFANGLLVKSGPALRLSQSEDGAAPVAEEDSFWDSWGWNTGTVLLAAGAGLALVVATAGNEAEDLQNGQNNEGGNGAGNGDTNVCVVGPVVCVPIP